MLFIIVSAHPWAILDPELTLAAATMQCTSLFRFICEEHPNIWFACLITQDRNLMAAAASDPVRF